MIKYNFTETYELDNKEVEKYINSPIYPYFIKTDKNIAMYKVCRFIKGKKSLDRNKCKDISSYVKVEKRYADFDTQKVKLIISFFNGGQVIQKTIDRSMLTKSKIETLAEYGIYFNTNNPKDFLEYLGISEQFATTYLSHNQLGWDEFNGKKVFKSSRLFVPESLNLQSEYLGGLDLTPKGDRDKWFEMIKSEVIGNIPLTTVMLAGFASPLLGFLNEKYDLGSILFNLSNSSSKGKTTAAMLATSVFGNPTIDKSTMITFNATNNALVSFASKCNSHTIALDEAVISTASDVTKQLYTLCAGRDKLRLNTDSELKEATSFSSFIISTAEFDLIPDSATNGIRARVFELKDTFTTSAENSVKIKSTVAENYGFAGNEFIEFIMKEKIDKIEEDYLLCQKALITKFEEKNTFKSKGELTERVFSKLAIILQAGAYFDECFGIEIDNNLIDYLLSIEKYINENSDRTKYLLDCILQFIAVNENKFITEHNCYGFAPSAPWGRIIKTNSETEIIILKSKADEVFKDNKIMDSKNLLNTLKQKNIIDCEKDRLYKRYRLSSKSEKQSCYIFKISFLNEN